MRNLLALLLASFLVLPAAASAGPELTLSAGRRSGEVGFLTDVDALIVCVTTPCPVAEARTADDRVRYTLILDVPFSRRWMVEVLFTEQDGAHEFDLGVSPLPSRGTYEWTTAQAGVLRHWREDRLRPFAAAALGATRFESTALAYQRPLFPEITAFPVDEEVLSASLAGGIKVGLGRRLALRLEGRGWWHDLPDWLDGALWQGEASAGLTYRW